MTRLRQWNCLMTSAMPRLPSTAPCLIALSESWHKTMISCSSPIIRQIYIYRQSRITAKDSSARSTPSVSWRTRSTSIMMTLWQLFWRTRATIPTGLERMMYDFPTKTLFHNVYFCTIRTLLCFKMSILRAPLILPWRSTMVTPTSCLFCIGPIVENLRDFP